MYVHKRSSLFTLIAILSCMIACSGDDGKKGIGESSSTDAALGDPTSMDGQMPYDSGATQDGTVTILPDGGVDVDTGLGDASRADAQQSTDDASLLDMSNQIDGGPAPQSDMGLALWHPEPTPALPIVVDTGPTLELLLVGDNYVGLNGLCEKITALAEGAALWDTVQCEMVSSGGFRLIDHADAAASGEALGAFLDAQNPARTQFDLMILQERAQVAGFPSGQPFRNDFEQAAEELSIRASASGIATALLMTWGRDGDPNVGLYPDYETMQRRIADAHYEVAQNLDSMNQESMVIEAGEVWFRTHERDPSMDFRSLFMPNDHHPSDAGSWLLAAVILSRGFGLSPDMLPIVPELPTRAIWLRLLDDIIQN